MPRQPTIQEFSSLTAWYRYRNSCVVRPGFYGPGRTPNLGRNYLTKPDYIRRYRNGSVKVVWASRPKFNRYYYDPQNDWD